jgi:hypothetical protein
MYISEGGKKIQSEIYGVNNIKVNQKNKEEVSEQKLVEFDEGYSNNIDRVELSPEAKDYEAHGAGGRGGTRRGGDA